MERRTHFLFFLVSLSLSLSLQAELVKAQNGTTPIPVGVVLDLGNSVGKMCKSSISMALDDFYAANDNYTTRLVLHTRDSSDDVVGAASAALDLLKNVQVQAIIGPLRSAQAMFVIDLGNKTQVPILSFSATSPSLSPAQEPYFVRTGLNSSSQVKTIASLIKNFGWREVVPIYEDTEYGTGFLPYLVDAVQGIDARVPYRVAISPSTTDDQITKELHKLMAMQTRVFVIHMLPSLGSRLFLKAKKLGMMTNGYVWIITDGLTDLLDSLDPRVVNSMQGVLGVKPYLPMSKMLNNFTTRWRYKFHKENPNSKLMNLSTFGLWAYDTVWALAMAIEQVGAANSRYQKTQILDNSTDLMTLGISKMGPRLLEAILRTKFNGLGGAFYLLNGQLQSSAFQIVNVIEKGWKDIGFWTPSQKLNSIGEISLTSNKGDLGHIIWPGGVKSAPKGWEIPTGKKKLRVGVPMKAGFSEFVKVEIDPLTNATIFSGYCIDVFDAVIQTLNYSVPYEYIPFDDTYDNLVYQVFLKNFDAVVGDITIVANRSLYVDFTLPYTESGVSMIVPIKDGIKKNAWTFLKPLSADLWVGSLAFFFFTGFVVWVIEHRINIEFRGPPSQQMGIIFYFAFSTLVFAHKEKVVSNLSRVVVIIWLFVVLILTSSYTASLTSMLTAQQLQPTVTDINDLLKNGDYVGYQDGSFVLGLLKNMKFDESKLKPYATPSEYAEALSKGSQNDGVAAIFDEIPYIKIFLADNCSDYIMVGPTYKTDGFGFVFPRGSPLVPDISRAVLNVTQGDKMVTIENRLLRNQTACRIDNSVDIQSYRLTFQSFWGLFLITGAVSTVSLLIYFAMFFWKNRDELKTKASQNSLWRVFAEWAKHYDQKDLNSHTFKRDDVSMKQFATSGETPRADGSQSPYSGASHHSYYINSGTPAEMLPSPPPGLEEEASTPVSLRSMELTEVADGHLIRI